MVASSASQQPPPIAQVHPQIQSKIKPEVATTTQCNNLIVSNAAGGNLSYSSNIISSSGSSVNVCVQPSNVLSGTSLSSGQKGTEIQQQQSLHNQMLPSVSVNFRNAASTDNPAEAAAAEERPAADPAAFGEAAEQESASDVDHSGGL